MSLDEASRGYKSSLSTSSLESCSHGSPKREDNIDHERVITGTSANVDGALLKCSPSATTIDSSDWRKRTETADDRGKPQETLTLEDCIDMDVDVLTTVLERSFQTLKRDTLDFFVDARTRFKTRALHELNQERRAAERKQCTKEEEVRLLDEELKNEKRRSEKLMTSVSRIAEAVGSAHQRKRSYRLLLTVYQAWIEFAKSEKRLKHKMHRALRHYCDEYLKRRSLVQWVECLREQHRTCARERFQTKLDIARGVVESEFKERYAALEEENKKLKEKLKTEVEARSKLEEDMQQAFMRGVCALNMEALSVMKRGMPPNGINPFFDATEPPPDHEPVSETPQSEGQVL